MQVYCTQCKYYKELIKLIEKSSKKLPPKCINCYPWDTEDSRDIEERPNYVKENN